MFLYFKGLKANLWFVKPPLPCGKTVFKTVASKSQDTINKEVTSQDKSFVQTTVQTKLKKSPKSGDIDTSKLPPDLTEIISIWPKLPEHIKAAIKLMVQDYGK